MPPRGLDLIFPVLTSNLYQVNLLLYDMVRVRVVVMFLLFFSGSQSKKQACMVTYDIKRSFRRLLRDSTQTGCKSCRVDPKIHHPAKRSLAMCEHTGGVLRDFIVVIHRDICREHSLTRLRNYLMPEAANSLSAAAGPE